jgi:hypothetical protein
LRVSSQLQNRVGNSFLSQNLLFQTSEYFLILAFLEIFCFPPSLIDPYSALIGGVNFVTSVLTFDICNLKKENKSNVSTGPYVSSMSRKVGILCNWGWNDVFDLIRNIF